ncbi:hypothetical protein WA171_007222 [Blastocystis sp. BT1]
MRLKCRYLIGILEIDKAQLSKPLRDGDVLKEIRNQLEVCFGLTAIGHEHSLLQFIAFNVESGLFCLRCGRDWSNAVMVTLIYTKSICKANASFRFLETVSTEERGKEAFRRHLSLLPSSS